MLRIRVAVLLGGLLLALVPAGSTRAQTSDAKAPGPVGPELKAPELKPLDSPTSAAQQPDKKLELPQTTPAVPKAQQPDTQFDLPKPTPVEPKTKAPTTPKDATSETAQEEPQTGTIIESSSMVIDGPARDAWHFWVSADYAVAFLKNQPLPPLATTSPPTSTQAVAGIFGNPNTRDLIGNAPISAGPRSLGRLDFGYWFDPERIWGVGAGFFVTESKGEAFTTISNGSTIIARPFFDATTGIPSSVLVAFPGISSGQVNVYGAMQSFWGANLDAREAFLTLPWLRMESLFGFRYLHYGEDLEMVQNLLATGGVFVPGTKIVSADSFITRNDFYGAEFGLETGISSNGWSLDVLTKMAAGTIRRQTNISGITQTSVPGSATTTNVGGVYALQSNIGTHNTNDMVVAPEFGLKLSYQLTSNVQLHWGYSFLFLDGIARAADQVDFTLNQNQFPPAISGGPQRPSPVPVRSDIWVQSINFGVEIRY